MKKLIATIAMAACCTAATAQQLPYQNPDLTADQRAEDLCRRLTLNEKIKLMRNGSPAIQRLGIPQFEWWSEALHGTARNGFATVFPITTGMAASWNESLLLDVFTAIGNESRVKGELAKRSGNIKKYQGLSIWTPNINIFRDPRWGRGQETYGEDPYLTARMGLAVVEGLQGPKGSKHLKNLACAKHFAVHSGPEWNRHSFNIENLPERDLWETYIPAFKALVQEGDVAEVMCAYQRIDGEPCCGNNRYLQQILRGDLGFKGMVVSDCGAIGDFWIKGRHEVSPDAASASAKAVLSGTDVECGANYNRLDLAVERGEITEAQIDTSIKRLLKARFMLGDFDDPSLVEWTKMPESTIASKEHKALALKMARETMTLLLNKNNILPLSKNARIAVMGPNAADSIMMWGNYNGYPTYSTTILQGICGKAANVNYIKGCGYTKNEVIDSRFNEISTADGKPGITVTYWNNENMEGTPAATEVLRQPINKSNGGATVFAPGVNLEHFSACCQGVFRPTRSEEIELTSGSDDKLRVIVNGDTLINQWKSKARIIPGKAKMKVEAGKEYSIKVDYVQETDMAAMQFDLGCRIQLTDDAILRSVADADIVIFAGGISPLLEGEEMKVTEPGFKGGDRTDIELPEAQRKVIAMLHKAGKKVIFVNCSGGAIALVPETENCEAIMQAWYPGEQGGQAVAEVLFGDVNPSGHLPVTFYRSTNDLPDFLDYTMKNRTYRYFKGEALFPFGYGLSYTTFSIRNAKYNAKNGKLTATVENTGKRDGAATIQVYISRPDDTEGPIKTLRAYKKTEVKAGGKQTVEIALPKESFEWWDKATNTMKDVAGKYIIHVGQHSQDPEMLTVKAKM